MHVIFIGRPLVGQLGLEQPVHEEACELLLSLYHQHVPPVIGVRAGAGHRHHAAATIVPQHHLLKHVL